MGYLLTRRREMILQSGGGELIENFDRVGSPTIENGIMTTSSGNYITTPESFNPGSDPWELTVKLFRPSIPNPGQIFLQGDGIRISTGWKGGSAAIYLYSDGGTIVGGSNSKSVPAGEWCWLKAVFAGDATGYDYGVSSDGITFTYIGGNSTPYTGYRGSAYKTATPIKAGVIAIGSGSTNAQYDLMATVIKINGSVWWKPYKRG